MSRVPGRAERVLVFGFAQHDTKALRDAIPLRSSGPAKSRKAFKAGAPLNQRPFLLGG